MRSQSADRNKECLIVLSGNFLNDRAETAFGITPGIEDNETFAENLIDLLTLHIRAQDHAINSYELFRELEAQLGRFIQNVLSQHGVNGDFSELIPDQIRNQLRISSGLLDYSLATYFHLVRILKSNWSRFEQYFSIAAERYISSDEVLRLLFEINARQRVYLAHPHKASQQNIQFGAEDVLVIKSALEFVRGAYAESGKSR